MSAWGLLLSLLAVLGGALLPLQGVINAKLSVVVGGPILATCISFASGLAALAVLAALVQRPSLAMASLGTAPPWIFVVGGLLGATYLTLTVFLTPRIGAAAMMCLAVAGQIGSALVIDRLGLFGLVVQDLSWGRLVGAVLIAFGVILVRTL